MALDSRDTFLCGDTTLLRIKKESCRSTGDKTLDFSSVSITRMLYNETILNPVLHGTRVKVACLIEHAKCE